MARETEPTPVAKLGFAIAFAAFVVVVALGFSRQTVPPAATGDSLTSTVACGSVFSPEVEPLCDSTRSSRKSLMLAVGIPGVALGIGIVIVGSRRPPNEAGQQQ